MLWISYFDDTWFGKYENYFRAISFVWATRVVTLPNFSLKAHIAHARNPDCLITDYHPLVTRHWLPPPCDTPLTTTPLWHVNEFHPFVTRHWLPSPCGMSLTSMWNVTDYNPLVTSPWLPLHSDTSLTSTPLWRVTETTPLWHVTDYHHIVIRHWISPPCDTSLTTTPL